MSSLSFDDRKNKSSVPIAYVKGGDLDGEILYLHTDGFKPVKKPSNNLNMSQYHKLLSHYPKKQRLEYEKKIREYLDKNLDEIDDENEDVKYIYNKLKNQKEDNHIIDLPYGSMFNVIPSIDSSARQIFYISGASGSGKSYFCKGICESYQKLHPDRDIYLISKLSSDETLDSMKKPAQRLNIESFLTDPPKLEEFENSMIIFDDYDTLDQSKKHNLYGAVLNLIDDVCIQGRHYNISCCIISHYNTLGLKTRLLLTESMFYVVYPQNTSYHALKYLLKTYAGMDEDEIKTLKKLGSRWVCIHKNYPQYLISQNQAKILNV
jgi:hypothetical protein